MKKVWLLVVLFLMLVGCDEGGFTAFPNLTPVLWTAPVNGSGRTVLLDNLMIGTTQPSEGSPRYLLAVDVVKREIAWRYPVGNAFIPDRQFALNDELAVIFLKSAGLLVLSRQGELLAKVPPPLPDEAIEGVAGAGPLFFQTRLYVPNDKFLYAYDMTNPSAPTLVWRKDFEKTLWSLAVDDEGTIYAGISEYTGLSALRALAPENGTVLWQADTATPQQVEGGVYAPTALTLNGDKLIAAVESSYTIQTFDRKTGQRLSVSEELLDTCVDGAGMVTGLEVGGGKVYFTPSSGTCVYSVDLASGQHTWVHTARTDPDTSFTYGGTPKYVNGVVYATNSALWALDADTGKVLSLASKRDDHAIFTTVQFSNGEVLVWGDELTVYKPLR